MFEQLMYVDFDNILYSSNQVHGIKWIIDYDEFRPGGRMLNMSRPLGYIRYATSRMKIITTIAQH